jgi:hypothetical protein
MHPRVSIFLQTVKAFWMDRHRTKSTAPEPNLLNLKHEPISLKLRIGDWGSIETVTRDYFRLADYSGVIAWWLESKCRMRPLLRIARYTFI